MASRSCWHSLWTCRALATGEELNCERCQARPLSDTVFTCYSEGCHIQVCAPCKMELNFCETDHACWGAAVSAGEDWECARCKRRPGALGRKLQCLSCGMPCCRVCHAVLEAIRRLTDQERYAISSRHMPPTCGHRSWRCSLVTDNDVRCQECGQFPPGAGIYTCGEGCRRRCCQQCLQRVHGVSGF